MADLEFNTTAGQTIARELLIAYLNTGTAESPSWSAFGKRVEDSDEEMDWSQESTQDILGNTWTTMKKPIITQSFDPIPMDAGDAAAVKLWNLGVKDQNAQSLANQDIYYRYYICGDFDGLESFLCANESIKIKANAQISTAEKNGEWEDISNTMQTQTEKM